MKSNAIKKLNSSKVQIEETSLFTLKWAIIGFAILACVMFFIDLNPVGMILLGLAIIGIVGRLWTRIAAKKLAVHVDSEKAYMFPNDTSSIEFDIENDKAIGVSYLEMVKPFKKPLVIEPDDYDETEEEYSIRCSLIKGHQSSKYNVGITAKKRGIESLKNTNLFVGDPFGLARIDVGLDSSSIKEFVVYPQLVPVNISRFTKDLWEGEHSNRGVLDDISVIKLTRPYELNDPEKSINWRLLARGQGLMTNQYEVISPKRMHIFFDGHSFNGRADGDNIVMEPKKAELENALSILASLTLKLETEGIYLGFSFPKTPTLNAVNIRGQEGSSMEALYRMADFKLFDMKVEFGSYSGDVQKSFEFSHFEVQEILDSVGQYGKCYFVTYDEKSVAKSELLKSLSRAGVPVTAITYEELKLLREGGADNE